MPVWNQPLPSPDYWLTPPLATPVPNSSISRVQPMATRPSVPSVLTAPPPRQPIQQVTSPTKPVTPSKLPPSTTPSVMPLTQDIAWFGPVQAARSFTIHQNGTVLDNQQKPMSNIVPPIYSPLLQRHGMAILGIGAGGLASIKLHRQLRPLNLQKVQWHPQTPWPWLTQGVNAVVQSGLQWIKQNKTLNGLVSWVKLTALALPMVLGARLGERQQHPSKASTL
jgi:hypothetical protein